VRRVLIVDDEKFAVEGLLRYVDWKALGATRVRGAYSAREAEAALAEEGFDVLVCDIEMPLGTGLELASLATSRYPGLDVVFLTCHADFSYAQEALRLGSFDYLLKPVPYKKLEECLARLFAKREDAARSDLSDRHRLSLAEAFWLGLADGRISGLAEELASLASENGVDTSCRFAPLVFAIRRWSSEMGERDRGLLEFAMRQAISELFKRRGEDARALRLAPGKALVIVRESPSAPSTERSSASMTRRSSDPGGGNRLRDAASEALAYCRAHFYCELSAYIGEARALTLLGEEIGALRRLEANSYAVSGEVASLEGVAAETHGPAADAPDPLLWSALLAAGNAETVKREALRQVEAMSTSGQWDAASLHRFRQDFAQALFSLLKARRVAAHELFDDPYSIDLERRAADSLADLSAWISFALDSVAARLDELERGKSPCERAAKYITRHLPEELSCAEVARMVSLNQDYLSRLFKKEMGLSMSEYVIAERIKEARCLLEKSDLPVGEIASRVGYANFSHFSETFRKATGDTPTHYRARFRPNS
jgi:Response regulator containing CheY-like receiver domain and AraC-type DNA-binding domain